MIKGEIPEMSDKDSLVCEHQATLSYHIYQATLTL
ncbi:hypothetical protein EDB38_11659 [Vibrio crassostreae]|nr:hypothetical protein EDB58_1209 [Vibrio crassostreae]TCN04644.1 hypothetical protein EDB35_12214 [Vibrio crassostreae]TCT47404.1 hypothetical protein EDB42_11646 [Vibrio crassostreae]TCT59278.1 hypothetical protein EDB44_1178 [Vibrio crassostreae]TCT72276.1 hypothetical protein EDB41_11646 [Vibrio crassostreae]